MRTAGCPGAFPLTRKDVVQIAWPSPPEDESLGNRSSIVVVSSTEYVGGYFHIRNKLAQFLVAG